MIHDSRIAKVGFIPAFVQDSDIGEVIAVGDGMLKPLRSAPASIQADFFVGKQNSITFPRCCEGTHFTRFAKLVGM
jgi:hypothetical protein